MPPMVGEISLFPYNFAPRGWMFCDGALLPISENEALFQLIGFTYGGDGQEAFALPNLTQAAPPHLHYAMSLFGSSTNFNLANLTSAAPHGYTYYMAVKDVVFPPRS